MAFFREQFESPININTKRKRQREEYMIMSMAGNEETVLKSVFSSWNKNDLGWSSSTQPATVIAHNVLLNFPYFIGFVPLEVIQTKVFKFNSACG